MNPNTNSSKKRHDKWRNDERHYCATCNVWMGSDRQSIALHENGKKHKENVEFQLLQRRQAVLKEEKDAKNLQSALRQMEQFATARQSSSAAAPFLVGSVPPICTSASSIHTQPSRAKQPPQANTAKDQPPSILASSDDGKVKNISSSNNNTNGNSSKRSEQIELNAWQERKQKRERDHASQIGEEADEIITSHATPVTSKHVKLGELEGYYTIGTLTFLEGKYYAPIFEPDMPIEIWTGAHSLNNPVVEHEMRQEVKSTLWKAGLVVKKRVVDNTNELLFLFDVAYLLHPEDEDETFEENVHPTRLRLVIHPSQTNDSSVSIKTADDPRIPKSIEEARLMLLGGEEEVLVEPTSVDDNDIDENTGFTKFQTVSIKRMTVSHEEQQQLEVEREKKKREKEEELLNKDLVKRVKMEEAKYLGAEDSALGAYDVWGTSGGGYKGVSITTTSTKAVTGKSLSKGTVEFKKKNSNSSKNRNNRRTTSAED